MLSAITDLCHPALRRTALPLQHRATRFHEVPMRPALLALLLASVTPAGAQSVPIPAAITADGVPAIPTSLADAVRPYLENRFATFQAWDPVTRGMLVTTRFGNAQQLHKLAMPGGARTQISFEAEPVPGGSSYAPDGKTLLVGKDIGGNEFFQLYTLADGQLRLLTDGKSRNTGAVWSKDGKTIGYSSSRRNGTDSDLRRVEYGDERNLRQRLKLTEISPLTRASELKIPLIVVTGGNDPRVPASEAGQMVDAVRNNGGRAWHILAANEGHGYRKKENRDDEFLATLTFWQQTLLN
jgi:hypothetical protein